MLTDAIFSLASFWTISCTTSSMALVLLCLHTTLKWPIFMHSVHVFPYTWHCLGWWLLLQYLHVCFMDILVCVFLLGLSLHAFFDILILSNTFASVIPLITADCVLCTLILFAHAKTFPLIIILSTFTFVSSQIISPSISVSLNLGVNCSFSCLLSSW